MPHEAILLAHKKPAYVQAVISKQNHWSIFQYQLHLDPRLLESFANSFALLWTIRSSSRLLSLCAVWSFCICIFNVTNVIIGHKCDTFFYRNVFVTTRCFEVISHGNRKWVYGVKVLIKPTKRTLLRCFVPPPPIKPKITDPAMKQN